MAKGKRSRRPRSSAAARARQNQPARRVEAAAAVRSGAPQVAATEPKGAQPTNFAAEYHYVLTDLKRLGLLAAGLFVLLIVLALTLG